MCFHTHKKCDALNIYVFVSLRFAFAYSMSKNAWSRSKRTGAESRGLEPQSGAGSPHSFVPYIDSTDSMGCIPKKERRPRTLKTRPATIAVSLVCERLQKGGVPAAPSGTATLLRLSPNHRFRPRPTLAATDFRRPRLSWLDGRCVQGPGTYSPRHG